MQKLDFKYRKLFVKLKRFAGSKEAIVVTGFRRVGKTTLLRKIYNSVKTDNKLFLDLETVVNQRIFEDENYENIKLTLEGLGINFSKKAYIFLDEIQLVKNITSVIKYFYDNYKIKFYLTGSSSFYLKNRFSESLSGRKYIFDLFPLDFEEFILFKGLDYKLSPLSKLPLKKQYNILSGYYSEYLEFGGFPEVVLEKNTAQKQLKLDDILGSYFKIDVASLANFKENENLKKLVFLLPSRVGSKLDIGKIAQTLNVSRITANSYLDFFVQTYLINLVKPLSASRDIEIKEKPKPYFCDTGLLNRIAQVSRSQLFENKVFNQLYMRLNYIDGEGGRLFDDINYYSTKYGAEIDFIYRKNIAYEVKLGAGSNDLGNLARRAKRLRLKEYKVVSLKEAEGKENIIYPYFFNTRVW